MHIYCCTCSNNVICDWNILVNNITRWIHVFLQCFLDQNHYFFIFSDVIMKMELMKNNPVLCFTKIFTPLSAFKILQIFLPGIFHCLGSRLCFVVLTCWYSVHSRSPPNTPLATRSHTFVSPHDTQICISLKAHWSIQDVPCCSNGWREAHLTDSSLTLLQPSCKPHTC